MFEIKKLEKLTKKISKKGNKFWGENQTINAIFTWTM
jgi:hypothetical protein